MLPILVVLLLPRGAVFFCQFWELFSRSSQKWHLPTCLQVASYGYETQLMIRLPSVLAYIVCRREKPGDEAKVCVFVCFTRGPNSTLILCIMDTSLNTSLGMIPRMSGLEGFLCILSVHESVYISVCKRIYRTLREQVSYGTNTASCALGTSLLHFLRLSSTSPACQPHSRPHHGLYPVSARGELQSHVTTAISLTLLDKQNGSVQVYLDRSLQRGLWVRSVLGTSMGLAHWTIALTCHVILVSRLYGRSLGMRLAPTYHISLVPMLSRKANESGNVKHIPA